MKNDVEAFWHGELARYKAWQKQRSVDGLENAPDFNVINQFVKPNEMRLSQIIAWLLDPKASHGQGNMFLSLFLQSIGQGNCVINNAYVRTEVCTAYGRLDILLREEAQETALPVRMVIENKPFANEGSGQLEGYQEYLAKYKKENQIILVFISGTGQMPLTVNNDELYCKCITLSYKHIDNDDKIQGSIEKWLEECISKCKAETVRLFLNQLLDYVKTTFDCFGGKQSEISFKIDNGEGFGEKLNVLRTAFLNKLATCLQNELERQQSNLADFEFGYEGVWKKDSLEANEDVYVCLKCKKEGYECEFGILNEIRYSNAGFFFYVVISDCMAANKGKMQSDLVSKYKANYNGRVTPSYYWWYAEPCYKNWNSPEMILDMADFVYGDGNSLGYFVDEIMALAGFVQNIIQEKE